MAAGHELYRETGDVDLGIPPIVAQDRNLVGRLKDLNYLQVAGNRFARGLSDIPAGMKEKGSQRDPEALIDILIPAYTSRAHENVQVGDDLFTTEVPGLHLALARPPVVITLELHRLNGAVQSAEVIRSLFDNRDNAPVAALASGQRLSAEATDVRLTRIRALIAHVLGSA
jgi:hypothetical protein